MAKTGSVIAAIRAKPNARGKTSHLPLKCSTNKCENDFYISHCNVYPPIRKCPACYQNPPQQVAQNLKAAKAAKDLETLKSLGLITQ